MVWVSVGLVAFASRSPSYPNKCRPWLMVEIPKMATITPTIGKRYLARFPLIHDISAPIPKSPGIVPKAKLQRMNAPPQKLPPVAIAKTHIDKVNPQGKKKLKIPPIKALRLLPFLLMENGNFMLIALIPGISFVRSIPKISITIPAIISQIAIF